MSIDKNKILTFEEVVDFFEDLPNYKIRKISWNKDSVLIELNMETRYVIHTLDKPTIRSLIQTIDILYNIIHKR